MTLKEFYTEWFSQNSRHHTNQFIYRVKKSPAFMKEIDDYIKKNNLPKDLPDLQKLYLTINEKKIGECVICSAPTGFLDWWTGYSETCGKSCRTKKKWLDNPKLDKKPKRERSGKTFSELTQNVWDNRSEEDKKKIIEKRKATNLKKYGVTNPMMLESSKDNRKKVMVERYGVETPFRIPEVRQKIDATNLERYGSKNVMQNAEIRKKNFLTGTRKKLHQGILTQGDGDKIIDILLLDYTQDEILSEFQCPYLAYRSADGIERKYCPDFYIPKDNLIIEVKSMYTFMVDLENNILKSQTVINHGYRYKFFIVTHQKQILVFDGETNLITEIIKEIYPDELILTNEYITFLPRKKKLFYIRDITQTNLIQEENDLHRFLIQKNNVEVKSYFFFSDLVTQKKNLVESFLKNLLGFATLKLGARECDIKIVAEEEKKNFLNENHLSGNCRASLNFGLYYKDELVSLMTISKYRRMFKTKTPTSEKIYEIVRFCSKKGYSIRGAGSRLFSYFIDNYEFDSVISYSENDYFDGGFYEHLGFLESHKTKSGYYYSDGETRHHRYKFKKNSLVEQGYDKEKTESQIMAELGYAAVYNRGITKWVYLK